MRHAAAWVFNERVPDDVEGYHELIAEPMDLGTIKKRLKRGEYATLREYFRDVALVWRNCYTFNEEGSEIWELARECEAAHRRLCAEAGLTA